MGVEIQMLSSPAQWPVCAEGHMTSGAPDTLGHGSARARRLDRQRSWVVYVLDADRAPLTTPATVAMETRAKVVLSRW